MLLNTQLIYFYNCLLGNFNEMLPLDKDIIATTTELLFTVSGCDYFTVADSLACLRNYSTADFYQLTQDYGIFTNLCIDDIHIPADYMNIIRDGSFNTVPTMIGSTFFESAYVVGKYPLLKVLYHKWLHTSISM